MENNINNLENVDNVDKVNDDISLTEKVLEIIKNSDKPLKPSEIALLAGFPHPTNTAKKVNPTLYNLSKEGKIMKKCDKNGGNPTWTIDNV